jgi:hypothetical protein
MKKAPLTASGGKKSSNNLDLRETKSATYLDNRSIKKDLVSKKDKVFTCGIDPNRNGGCGDANEY